MKATLRTTEQKNLNQPDEVRSFPHGKVELLHMGEGTIGRITLEPGWRWSKDVKSIAGTRLCEAPHFQYHVSGRLHVQMEDGRELELGPGDVSCIAPGHEAWVVGNEPVVLVDWYGATGYAKQRS